MKKNYLNLSRNHSNFHSIALKFKNLSTKIDELMNTGKFWEFSKNDQDHLVSKLRRLFNKLSGFNPSYALKIAGAAMCFALLSNTTKAQTFTEWTDNPFASLSGEYIDGAFADIDDDGDLDAILLNESGYPIYFENNEGTYTENDSNNPFNSTSSAEGTGIDIADFDKDGNLDAIFIDGANSSDISHYELVSGEFEYHSSDLNTSYFEIYDGYKAKFGDVDGDGNLDILITEYGHGITTLVQQANHSFIKRQDYPVNNCDAEFGSFGINMNVVDMDGDGDDDLFVFQGDYGSPGALTAPYGSSIVYYENTDGSGDFVSNTDIPLPTEQMSNSYFPLLVDLDGDGDIDVFLPNAPTDSGNLQNGDNPAVPVSPLVAFALFAAGGFGIFRRNRNKNII